jgi:hypothetical protein
MIRDIVIKDTDQHRDYHCQARFRCIEEIGGAPGICCDLHGIELESCVVWLGDYGCEVNFGDFRQEWQREIEREYRDEIIQACIAVWESERWREPRETI